ncbi:MAG: hypothetical protein EXR78_01180 [Deltaproteobacteria bacterium]|nr:hypothetical protein [Deltaproteobacteria bacterium]
MPFDEMLNQVRELLQSKGRGAYRALKRRFDLDDEYLEDLKSELIKAERVAVDEDGEVLVWTGSSAKEEPENRKTGEPARKDTPASDSKLRTPNPELSAAERRQLTVMFCDLVGSTALSAQLDPEELRNVVRSYQETRGAVIRRYEGHIAQHLGDGLLVYFGYPTAHEDDAQRAVRAGLEIIGAMRGQVTGDGEQERRPPLQVRIGIHTGLVVIGEIGSSEKREMLALGETPNIAARIQGHVSPDEVMISAATYRLVEGLFACEDRGQPELKGVTTPLTLHRVVRESEAQSRFDVAVQAGLTPLVGREEEFALLRRRWEQAPEGEGQVVLLSGEAGIGKSRLVQELKDQIAQNSAVRIEFRCSPYHQNSAFYPLIEHVQQVLCFVPSDTPHAKVQKLEQTLARYHFPQSDTVPLLAALLSLPHPDTVSPLTLTPQQQKRKTLDVLLHWLFEEAECAPVYTVWEDLHWADPSTLEFLALCLDQVPTARMLMLLTFRPEFTPTWASRSHVSHLVLSRLGRKQTSAIVEQLTSGKALPTEVMQQIVSKTDGVPLFVEELRSVYLVRGEVQRAHELGEQLLSLAESVQDPGFLLEARIALGNTSFLRGDFAFAHRQFKHALELYDPQHHRSHAFVYGLDPRVFGLARMGQILWLRGYPDQALQKAHDVLALAREIAHSFSSAIAELHVGHIHLYRREPRAVQQQAKAAITLCAEHKFANFLGQMMIIQGWAFAEQGFHAEGIAQIRQGLAACQATGARLFRPMYLTFMTEACWKAAQIAEGLSAVTEALAAGDKTGERFWGAELYRLKGELTLQKGARDWRLKTSSSSPQAPSLKPLAPSGAEQEAEECFLKAIEIAQRQQAKSLELRETVSLARLWQRQDKQKEDHQMLSEIYNWFTEGFDTKDLQEAKALIDELS